MRYPRPCVSPVVFLIFLLSLAMLLPGSARANEPVPNDWKWGSLQPPSVDPERDEVALAVRGHRIDQDFGKALDLLEEGLARDPRDDVLLDEYTSIWDAVRLSWAPEARELMARLERMLADLPEAARLYVRGRNLYLASNLREARAQFEKAAELAPDWSAPRLRGLLARYYMLDADESCHQVMNDMLADPQVSWRVVVELLWNRNFRQRHSEAAQKALAAWRDNEWGPYREARIGVSEAHGRVFSGRISQEELLAVIDELIEKYGTQAHEARRDLLETLTQTMPWDRFLALLEDRGWSMDRDFLLRAEARRQILLGADRLAMETFRQLRWPRERDRSVYIEKARNYLPADRFREEFEAYEALDILDRYAVDFRGETWEWYGEDDRAGILWNRLDRTHPLDAIQMRLVANIQSRPADTIALADSVATLGAPFMTFEPFRLAALEMAEGTTTEAQWEAAFHPFANAWWGTRRVAAAYLQGDLAKGNALGARLLEDPFIDIGDIGTLFEYAIQQEQEELADLCLAAWQERVPDTPFLRYRRFRKVLTLGKAEDAADLLPGIFVGSEVPLGLATELIRVASFLERDDLADVWLAAMREAAPGGLQTRLVAADLELVRGNHHESEKICQAILEEMPEQGHARRMLASATGSVDAIETWKEEGRAHDFVGLDLDYEDIGWMVEAAGDLPTEIPEEEARVLLERMSVDIPNVEEAYARQRRVLQPLTKSSCQALAMQEISFDADQGIPRVLVARVVRADGTSEEIGRDNIYVGGAQDGGIDVSESRKLMVPVPNLKKGDVIDLVWESSYRAMVVEGAAHQFYFFDSLPAVRKQYDIRYRKNLPIQVVSEGELDERPAREEGGAVIRTFEMRDAPALKWAPYSVEFTLRYPWAGYTTFGSWDKVAGDFAEVFWDRVEVTPEVEELARELTDGVKGKDAKIEALFEFVAREINSVAIELGAGRWVPTRAGEVLGRGYGDCKDKSALLLSLLRAVDIEGETVLIGTSPGPEPRKSFPNFHAFDHVLIYLPGWHGGRYLDPTLGRACARDIPDEDAGMGVLRIDAGGRGKLDRVPMPGPEARGRTVTADVWVDEGGRTATISLESTFRGKLAGELATVAEWPSEEDRKRIFVENCGLKLWGSCKLLEYSYAPSGCGEMTLRGTFRDTVWAGPQVNSVDFALHTNINENYVFSAGDTRDLDVAHLRPHRNRARFRIFHRNGWQPLDRNATLKIDNEYLAGRVEYKTEEEDGQPYLLQEMEFQLKKDFIPQEDYADFFRDWLAIDSAQGQGLTYTRILDEEQIAELMAMAAEDPDDYQFSIQAVRRILGSDYGGSRLDEGAIRRRAASMQLLQPLLEAPDGPSLAFLMAAAIQVKSHRFVRADSLVDESLRRDPGCTDCLQMSRYLKSELRDLEAELACLDRLLQASAEQEYVYQKAGCLIKLGREEEADRLFRRLAIVNATTDTTKVAITRLTAYYSLPDLEKAGEQIEVLREVLPPEYIRYMEAGHLMEAGDFAGAAEMYRELWSEDPTSDDLCNNLAWCYALCGEKLEDALTLGRATVNRSQGGTSSQNTLAVVLLRKGEWKEGRRLLRDLYDNDDRPSNRLVNGGFLALALYEKGDRDEALALWRSLEGMPGDPFWRAAMQKAVQQVEAGGEPYSAFFSNWQGD